MEKRRKQRICLAVVLTGCLLALMLGGCGGSSHNSMSEGAADTSYQMTAYDTGDIYEAPAEVAEEIAEEGAGQEEPVEVDEEASSGRKLIKTIHMDVETEDYPTLISTVTSRVEELGGYMENYDSYNENEIGSRGCRMTLRIPAQKLDGFLVQLGEISNIRSRSESVEDVTLQYVDMESHKKMLREEQERLLELLEQAETMEDIIAIESRLTDVRYQLESMEAQLRTIDNQVNYSTVYLDINEVERYTPPVEKGTWERIGTGFMENVYRVGDSLKEFFIGFMVSLPILFVLALLAAATALIVRAAVRAADKRSAKRKPKVSPAAMYGVPVGGMFGRGGMPPVPGAPAGPGTGPVPGAPVGPVPVPAPGMPAGPAPKAAPGPGQTPDGTDEKSDLNLQAPSGAPAAPVPEIHADMMPGATKPPRNPGGEEF